MHILINLRLLIISWLCAKAFYDRIRVIRVFVLRLGSVVHGGLERQIAEFIFLDYGRATFLAVSQSLLIFVEVQFEVACLAVYVLELGDEHLYLLLQLSYVWRFAELDGLDESVFKLCTKDLSGFNLVQRIADNNQVGDGLVVCHISASF